MDALDDALALFERRDQLFRAEAMAVPDETLRPRRIIEYLAKRLNIAAGAFAVKRFPAAVAPRYRGFIWKDGSRTIYLSTAADRLTEVHEGLHLLTNLPEAKVRELAEQIDRELDEPAYPGACTRSSPTGSTIEKEATVDWVY
jgi:hypothetical protein